MTWKQQLARRSAQFGFDPRKLPQLVRETPALRRDRKRFEVQRHQSQFAAEFPMGKPYRVFGERRQPAGAASGHYFHQDLLVARDVFARNPTRHIDVGSRVDGFVAHVASFREIEVVDIRPLPPFKESSFWRQTSWISRRNL